MTRPRRGIALTPMETRREIILSTARLADELGFELVSVPEGWGHDSSLLLAELAASTSRIRLVAGVFSIWGRTPATIAMTAATLYRMSEGRFILGLGASTKALAEGFHGVPYERPARQLREVATTVRALLRGEPAPAAVNGTRPIKLGQKPVPELPVWMAATGDQ